MNIASVIACFLTCLTGSTLLAQNNYPQRYFDNPVKIPIILAGNFGECRPGHFHSGLDIKTEGKENLPVYAAAEGYISRIKMEPGGFGHALYITHPNGYTTLYAHLNDFADPLQKIVHREQYARKSWELDLSLTPNQFPVKKGQLIARSGNTGGSTAPHLHFEIRDSKTEHPLNPQLFGFDIDDRREAVPLELVFYDAGKSIYEQFPQRVALKKNGSRYSEKSTITLAQDRCQVGIAVNDYMNGSDNTLSFYKMDWYWNDSLAGTITLDDIGYEETRYLNACADYALHFETGIWYNSLFVLKGNKLNKLYQIHQSSLLLRDSNRLRIDIWDNSGNQSTVQTTVFMQRKETMTEPCLPDWEAGNYKRFESPGVIAAFTSGSIYDDVCFQYERKPLANAVSALHRLHHPAVPLHTTFELSLQADRAVPFRLQNKICLRYTDGKDSFGKATTFAEQRYKASYRNFGFFWLDIDTSAPVIQLLRQTKKEIRLRITDKLTSVTKVVGNVKSNGKWLCFEQHGREWFYKFDEHLPAKGLTIIEVEATDENGNRSKKEFRIRL